ncbi:MAG: TetR/AcrR family transcriptional regulator [Oscillospiraceae bacterium]|jgi:AcrR family transcriptional regulator|nr:TetR/AcrR family transcriptional regulator [Oscillospiraceae bacterium]
MAGNFKREDLRTFKTRSACVGALQTLLEKRSFRKITVFGLCDEALVSRAAFYAHFADKYDLLRQWLAEQRGAVTDRAGPYRRVETARLVQDFLEARRVCLCNLMKELDDETRDLLSDFCYGMVEALSRKSADGMPAPPPRRRAALIDFCSGGLLKFLVTQARDNFALEDKTTIPYLCGMLEALLAWDNAREEDTRG